MELLKNKWVLYGGAALAVVAVGAVVLSRSSAPASSEAADTGLGSYFPPMVYGSGSVSSADPGGLNSSTEYSTDNSISQIIAANLATATLQSETTKYTAGIERDISLATLASNEKVAADANKTSIQQALANQLGAIAQTFVSTKTKNNSGFLGLGGGSSASVTGPQSITGSIGFDNLTNKINIDLAANRTQLPASPQATPTAAAQGSGTKSRSIQKAA